jgi:hypothetical protein
LSCSGDASDSLSFPLFRPPLIRISEALEEKLHLTSSKTCGEMSVSRSCLAVANRSAVSCERGKAKLPASDCQHN